ncbi:MAG: hypothetical protein RQ752_14360, partial [Thermohalobaculum sp.]|nr:hypothetical protein [Thermohalobaculum sp.]
MGAIDPLRGPMTDTAGPGGLRAAPPFPAVLRGPRRWLFLRLVLNGTLQGAAALLLPFAILGLAGAGLAGAPGGAGLVWGAVVPIGALALAVVGLRVIELSDAERLGLDYVAEMRLRLFDGLAAGLARSSHGVAMARMMNDLSALRNWVGLGLARSVSAGLALAGCLGAAVALSPQHAGAILVPLGLTAAAAVAMAGALGARVGEVRRLRGRLAKRLGEILPVLPVLRGRVAVAKARGRIERAGDALVAAQIRQIRIAAMLRALPDALMPGAVLAALAFGLPLGGGGAGATSSGAASVGLVLLAGLATGPLRQLFRALEYRAAFVVARERLAPGIAAGELGTAAAPAGVAQDARAPGGAGHSEAGGPAAVQAGPGAEPSVDGVPASGVVAVGGPAAVPGGPG